MNDAAEVHSAARGPEPGGDDRACLANEEHVAWEYDPRNEGDTSSLRWKTMISAGRTPSRGLSVGVMEVRSGAQLAPHHHHAREVYYVTAGEAEVFVEGAWAPVRAGDVVYFPGDAVHGARKRGGGTCRIVWAFPVDDYDDVEYFDD